MPASSDMAQSHHRWGEQLSAALTQNFPQMANLLLMGGMNKDPMPLISLSERDPAAQLALESMLQTFEAGHLHYTRSLRDEMQSATQNLKAEKEDLQAHNVILSQSIADLSKLLANSGTSTARHAKRFTTDPEKFDGAGKAAHKRQIEYKNWKHSIEGSHAMDAGVFDTDLRRIQHVSSLMTGEALDTYRDQFRTVQSNPSDPTKWAWCTVESLFEALDAHYITSNERIEASHKFDKLTMGGRPFSDFQADFHKLATKAEKTCAEKVTALRTKVSDALGTTASQREYLPDRDDYDGWVKLFAQIWDRKQEEDHIHSMRQRLNLDRAYDRRQPPPAAAPRALPPPPPTPNPADAGDPMVLDAIRGPRTSREERTVANACYYCGKTGHYRANCEERKRNAERFGRPQHPYQQTYQHPYQHPYQRGPAQYPPYPRQPLSNRAMDSSQGYAETVVSRDNSPHTSVTPSTSASNVDGSKNA